MADQLNFEGEVSAIPTPSHKGGRASREYLVKLRMERGQHPHHGDPLGPAGETCGSCAHMVHVRFARTYLKCGLGPDSRGPATDTRARWLACAKWKSGEATTVLAGK